MDKGISQQSKIHLEVIDQRQMLALIDETIAETSTCHFCGSSVSLETTAACQPYEAWLRCNNPACQRRRKIT